MDQSIHEPLTEIQKQQYLDELGLQQKLDNYNKEILKHLRLCSKCKDKGLICHKANELRKIRDRIFKLMREEYQAVS
tara:strand:- start:421 stop:651 length:231 start_codon:yes stop_codon:yes gene_type:complete